MVALISDRMNFTSSTVVFQPIIVSINDEMRRMRFRYSYTTYMFMSMSMSMDFRFLADSSQLNLTKLIPGF